MNTAREKFKYLGSPHNLPLVWKLLRIYFEKSLLTLEAKLRCKTATRPPYSRRKALEDRRQRVDVSFLIDQDTTNSQVLAFYRSLLRQVQTSWQVIYLPAETSSPAPEISDSRFQALPPQVCPGRGSLISACLPFVQGEWVVCVSPGAAYSENLVEQISAAGTTTAADILFWDERYGKGVEAFLKPAWSPELWLSVDLLDQAAFRTELLRSLAEGWEPGSWLAGAIRAARGIQHLEQVYSTLPVPCSKKADGPSSHAQQVSAWLRQCGKTGLQTQTQPGGELRLNWALDPAKVSIIIPTKNHYEDLSRCLDPLFTLTDYPDYEIILMDDHSTEPAVLQYYAELQAAHPNLRIHHNAEAFNFNRVCNQGARLASGSLLLFLNNDMEIIEAGWLRELVQFAQLPGVGAVGARLFYPDRRIQHSGIVVGLTGHANHLFIGESESAGVHTPFGPLEAYRDFSAVTGACVLIPRAVFDQVGGFDERYRLIFSDVAICLRIIAAGCRVVLNPWARLVHYEGRSRSHYIPLEDMLLAGEEFLAYHQANDPYYNPGLSRIACHPVYRRWYEMPPQERLKTIMAYAEKSLETARQDK